VIAIPVSRGFAGAAIDHEIARALADFFVEIIHQHAHGGFLLPTFAGELVTTRRVNGSVGGGFSVNRHTQMVLLNELGIQTVKFKFINHEGRGYTKEIQGRRGFRKQSWSDGRLARQSAP
jgi:hypothetical protein